MSSKKVLLKVPCKTLLLLDDHASYLHKAKTNIFIFALVSVHSLLHRVTIFGFVDSIIFLKIFFFLIFIIYKSIIFIFIILTIFLIRYIPNFLNFN